MVEIVLDQELKKQMLIALGLQKLELANPDRRKPTLIALDRLELKNAKTHRVLTLIPEKNGNAEEANQ